MYLFIWCHYTMFSGETCRLFVRCQQSQEVRQAAAVYNFELRLKLYKLI